MGAGVEGGSAGPAVPPGAQAGWDPGPATSTLLISLVAVGVYLPALGAGFAFDDHFAVEDNPDVARTGSGWYGLWRHDLWGRSLRSHDSHKSYRPLTVLSLKLDWLLYGPYPAGFHATNVVLHWLTTVGVYYLSLSVYTDSLYGRLRRTESDPSHPENFAALASALLFAAHPVHVEAVAGVVGRSEMISAVFFILGYHCYVTASQRFSQHCGSNVTRQAVWRMAALAMYGACFMLSAMGKETGVTLYGMVAARECFSSLSLLLTKRKLLVQEVVMAMTRWIFALGCVGMYFCLRTTLMSTGTSKGIASIGLERSDLIRKAEVPLITTEGWCRALSILAIHMEYWRLLLFPADLCCEYSYNCIPMVTSVFDVRPWIAVLALLIVLVCATWAFGSWLRSLSRESIVNAGVLLTSTLLLVIPFLPASHVFVTIGTNVAERVLYMPSMGWCIVSGWAVSGRRHLTPVFGLFVLVLSIKTMLRSFEWRSDEALFGSALFVCPTSAKMNMQYAQLLMPAPNTVDVANERIRWERARQHLVRAEELQPDLCDVDFQMAQYFVYQGNSTELGNLLERSVVGCPYTRESALGQLSALWQLIMTESPAMRPFVHMWMGRVYAALDMKEDSIVHYRECGVLYMRNSDIHEARYCFKRALAMDGSRADLYFWQGETAKLNGLADEAVEQYLLGLLRGDETQGRVACIMQAVTILATHRNDEYLEQRRVLAEGIILLLDGFRLCTERDHEGMLIPSMQTGFSAAEAGRLMQVALDSFFICAHVSFAKKPQDMSLASDCLLQADEMKRRRQDLTVPCEYYLLLSRVLLGGEGRQFLEMEKRIDATERKRRAHDAALAASRCQEDGSNGKHN